MRSNARGGYLKIKEVSGNLKNLLVLPLEAVPLFQLAIGRAMVAQHAGAGAAQQQEDGGSGGSGGGDADTSS